MGSIQNVRVIRRMCTNSTAIVLIGAHLFFFSCPSGIGRCAVALLLEFVMSHYDDRCDDESLDCGDLLPDEDLDDLHAPEESM